MFLLRNFGPANERVLGFNGILRDSGANNHDCKKHREETVSAEHGYGDLSVLFLWRLPAKYERSMFGARFLFCTPFWHDYLAIIPLRRGHALVASVHLARIRHKIVESLSCTLRQSWRYRQVSHNFKPTMDQQPESLQTSVCSLSDFSKSVTDTSQNRHRVSYLVHPTTSNKLRLSLIASFKKKLVHAISAAL